MDSKSPINRHRPRQCRQQRYRLIISSMLSLFSAISQAFILPPPCHSSFATPSTDYHQSRRSNLQPLPNTAAAEATVVEGGAANQESDRQFTVKIKRRLKEQQHYRVTFVKEIKELGELTDALIEQGALEVSYFTAEPLSFSLTLPVEGTIEVEAIMHLAWTMIERQQAHERSGGSSSSSSSSSSSTLLGWKYEKEIVLNAMNWFKAAAEPGFSPVSVGRFQVVPVQSYHDPPPLSAKPEEQQQQLCILPGEGWGDGSHPSTHLCLDFLSQEGVICGGERVIDYGTGSGILSIAAVQIGAREAVGIDVCYDALASAKANVLLNGVDQEVELIHPREVVPGEFIPGDVVIANILVGTLLAMRNTIMGAVKPGGWLVLSGLRPEQVEVIKKKYGKNVQWEEGLEKVEEVRNPTFGTGAGLWVRLVGRRVHAERWVDMLSEAAVS
ncbi:hypothetical protein VYU27_004838 [Nannochloropsis oceanica]